MKKSEKPTKKPDISSLHIFLNSQKIYQLLPVLAVGAYLRLYRISQYLTFLGDEGRDVLVVKKMIIDHKFTLLGPTASVGGFFLGPIYYYFMAPFLWLWNLDPTGPAVMVALFGLATITLLYYMGIRIFNFWTGFIAACLYALSPLVIAYSRSSWNPNIVPFFSTLLLLCLWEISQKPQARKYYWVAGIVMGIGLQLHYLFLFLYVMTAIWIVTVYWYRRFNLLNIVWLTGGIIIGLSPFLAFELRHGFPNTRSIYQFLTQSPDTGFTLSVFFTNINDVAFRSFGRLLLRLPDGGMLSDMPQLIQIIWKGGTYLILALSVGFGLVKTLTSVNLIKKTGKTAGESAGIFLITFSYVICLLLFGFYKKGIYDYYFGIFFAVPFLLFAYFLSGLIRNFPGKLVAGGIFIFLLFLNWEGRPFKYPPNNMLSQTKKVARFVMDKAGGKPFNFALVAGMNSDHAYRYFFEIWGNPPVTIENPEIDPGRKSVTGQLLVICEIPDCQPLGHPLWEIAGFGRAELTGSWDVPFVKVHRLIHYEGSHE